MALRFGLIAFRAVVLASASMAAVVAASPAFAQDAKPEATAAGSDADIVVTARRREEALSDTPVAVTAFGSESLESRNIKDLSDVALLTPGLSFEAFNGGGFGTPVIRGATQQSTTVLEQNVSVFLDGVYLPRQYAVDLGTENLARLEIVKGPQSALYGQNSFMGAINYITKSPKNEFGISGTATIGSDELYEIAGSINVPIAADKLVVLVNGSYSTFDGTWKNNHPLANADIAGPNTNGNFGGWSKWTAGAKALLTPTDNFRIEATYRRFEINNEGTARVNITGSNALSSPLSVTSVRNNCGVVSVLGPGLFCGELPPIDPKRFALDPRQFGAHSKTDFAAINVGFEPTDELSLKYGFGYIKSSVLQIQSQSDANMLQPNSTMNFTAIPFGKQEYSQHELRAEYAVSDNVEVSLGGFVSENTDAYTFLIGAGIPTLSTTPVTVANLRIVSSDALTNVKTQATFGALRFKLLDNRLRLNLEGRYSWEDKTVLSPAARVTRSVSASFFNPRVSIDFDVADDTMLYGSVASGTKAGGVNPEPALYAPLGGLLSSERTFGPDENWTYEIGVKSQLFQKRLMLELTGFYIDLTSLQINTLSTPPPGLILPPGVDRAPTILLNLGGATIKGLEFQGAFKATEGLNLTFGGSYQDATYNEGVVGTRTLGICDNIVCKNTIGGNQLQRSPSKKLFGGFVYEQPIGIGERDITFMLQGDVAYQNRQFVDETNTSTTGARTIVNMSTGFTYDRTSLRLWVKNLTNLNYVSSATFGPFRTSFYTPIAGPRRTFGLTLSSSY